MRSSVRIGQWRFVCKLFPRNGLTVGPEGVAGELLFEKAGYCVDGASGVPGVARVVPGRDDVFQAALGPGEGVFPGEGVASDVLVLGSAMSF